MLASSLRAHFNRKPELLLLLLFLNKFGLSLILLSRFAFFVKHFVSLSLCLFADAVNRGSDVEYSDIQICEDRRSQVGTQIHP